MRWGKEMTLCGWWISKHTAGKTERCGQGNWQIILLKENLVYCIVDFGRRLFELNAYDKIQKCI